MPLIKFKDRQDAAGKLAQKLVEYKGAQDTVVLGAACGGALVAKEIASLLDIPFTFTLIEKFYIQSKAIRSGKVDLGAVTESAQYLDMLEVQSQSMPEQDLQTRIRFAKEDLERRKAWFREVIPQVSLKGKRVIITDDGTETGVTAYTLIRHAKSQMSGELIFACPVLSDAMNIYALHENVKSIHALVEPFPNESEKSLRYYADYYEDFPQIADHELITMLKGV